MEIDDLKAMNDEDLANDMSDSQKALMNLRFRAATMQLSNINEIKNMKKRIARIKTLIQEREIAKTIS
tara:strand:+ start:278 stop:481 length:204 start_codon:yes stop_codon:yes gene_type:complete